MCRAHDLCQGMTSAVPQTCADTANFRTNDVILKSCFLRKFLTDKTITIGSAASASLRCVLILGFLRAPLWTLLLDLGFGLAHFFIVGTALATVLSTRADEWQFEDWL